MFTMGSTAFAAETEEKLPSDVGTVKITKQYTLENNGTESPAETFYLTQESKKVEDGEAAEAPDLEKLSGDESNYVAKVTFSKGGAGKSGEFVVTLPTYNNVGKYSYELKEVDGKTAGVTYRTDKIKLVVTVINGKDGKLIRQVGVHAEKDGKDVKSSSFNDNKYSAGTLNVTKKVTGNSGDKNKKFHFTVSVKNGNTDLSFKISDKPYSGSAETSLSDKETITLTDVPVGATVIIIEDDYNSSRYKTSYKIDGNSSVESSKAKITSISRMDNNVAHQVEFTNNKEAIPDTGVDLNSTPYILMLGIMATGAGVLLFGRRKRWS